MLSYIGVKTVFDTVISFLGTGSAVVLGLISFASFLCRVELQFHLLVSEGTITPPCSRTYVPIGMRD